MILLLQSFSIALFCGAISALLSFTAFASGIVTAVEIHNDSSHPLELLGTGIDLNGAAPSSFSIAGGERRELKLAGPRAWFIYGWGPHKCHFAAQHSLQQRFAQSPHHNYLPVWTRQAESIGERPASCKARLNKTLKAPPYSYSVKFSMS
ncbi:hypothetical protein [Pseudomonas agarici]|uniref:hypothetical protein n=1 Tax=Pseudomonas agarici TaxID=46677 RepID=UPI00031CDF6E|nr:hypothetical protein [Pseudomonas agarici]NWB89890.1 hypothetical protein [Pseudomonas agarici]NWC07338.1 hypothetical protein [Pseudomonas agarici]SEK47818.1 hypothetical protein SAMN05216604_103212 [Pseudomonas agarici]